MADATLATTIIETLKNISPWVSGSLGGAILTILISSREKRKKRKVITVDVTSNTFSIPRVKHEPGLSSDGLSISFKGIPYRNLVLYRTILRNTGNGGIDSPTFIYLFPKGTSIIEEDVSSSPLELEYAKEEKTTEVGVESSITWKRIEKSDEIAVSFLLDCPQPESIKCIPRGLDDIECRIGLADYENELENRIRLLLSLAALFVLFGAIPIIGNAFQSLVILFAVPHIIYVVKSVRPYRGVPEQKISIDNISVDKDGRFTVGQYTT